MKEKEWCIDCHLSGYSKDGRPWCNKENRYLDSFCYKPEWCSFMEKKTVDCHYCEHGCCSDEKSNVDCYVEDGGYFSHHVVDSKKEAEECKWFKYCNIFPRY